MSQQRRHDRRVLAVVAVALVALVAVVAAAGFGYQAWRDHRLPSVAPTGIAATAPVEIQPSRPVVFGPAGAAVTVQVYEDFHCPHCADFATELGPVLTDAQERGVITQEIYPMAFVDDGSVAAANGFACAAEAGFGPAYGAGLFANADLPWSDRQLIGLAELVSSEVPESFRSCVDQRAHRAWIDSISVLADQAGVTATPTVLVDGEVVEVSGLTPQALAGLIEDEAAAR